MRYCTNCGRKFEDTAEFCPECGLRVAVMQGEQSQGQGAGYTYTAPGEKKDAYDHTLQFSLQDVSDNKACAMLVYLAGIFGTIVACLYNKDSAYLGFHIRQGIKLIVVEMLVTLVAALLAWTIIVPCAAAVAYVVLVVLRIIAFFRVCSGKAVEVEIIRAFDFLR